MNIRNFLVPLLILQLFSCATIPDYKPIVDTSSVTDSAKYHKKGSYYNNFQELGSYPSERDLLTLLYNKSDADSTVLFYLIKIEDATRYKS